MTRTVLDTRFRAGRELGPPAVNTHVHLPPNFSAFDHVAAVVERARDEGVVAIGTANYFDFRVYRQFAELSAEAGIAALHGTEIITLQEDLQGRGVLVNDPANPGRTYMCGKAIASFDTPGTVAASLMTTIRRTSEERMAEMATRLGECARHAGLAEVPILEEVFSDVAARNGVPIEWVSLQERHLARALQEAIFAQVAPEDRGSFLAASLGGSVDAGVAADPIAAQEAIRSRLMRAGRPAFVPEAAVSFDDAYRLVLELDGIPCYPTLADGANPVCAFEDPPENLAEALLGRGVYLAELIPTRNAPDVVDRYVAAFRAAGILTLAGTEHNTQRMIPLTPTCRG
ncbi:MAG: hypothetical protein ACXWM8_05085, partial [Candidatus Limnocylindrales bacterium]